MNPFRFVVDAAFRFWKSPRIQPRSCIATNTIVADLNQNSLSLERQTGRGLASAQHCFFPDEAALLCCFSSQLMEAIAFDVLCASAEFYYTAGRVDLVAQSKSGDIFAFEAKLTRWRLALDQAYRNSSFAHYSYVVLPADAADAALKQCGEFERRGVGLCVVSKELFSIEIAAPRREPLMPWLTSAALDFTRRYEIPPPRVARCK